MAVDRQTEIWEVAEQVRATYRQLGLNSVVFEHGLPPSSGHGCGVDHAHVHVVGVAPSLRISAPDGSWTESSDGPLALTIDASREYLVVGLDDGRWLLRYEAAVRSQYLRRWLAAALDEPSWDWRATCNDRRVGPQIEVLRMSLDPAVTRSEAAPGRTAA